MKHYNLMPVEGDWIHKEVISKCGSLYPYVTTKKDAIEYAQCVKKLFPNVVFQLTEGDSWGNQTLVKEF